MGRAVEFVFTIILGLTGQAVAAPGDFVEADVEVLWWYESPAGGSFGWGVSELGDVDGDGATDLISGAPFQDQAAGATYVLSGKSGAILHAFPGEPGDYHGYAIADAGDTNGDGVSDVLVGAPGAGPGHAYLYSGATGTLLHQFAGEAEGDFFGAAVTGAGDVNDDGFTDVLVTAEAHDTNGEDAGRVYVYSGFDYALLHTVDGAAAGDHYGSAAGLVGDVNADGAPDQVIGARDAGEDRGGRATVISGRGGSTLLGPLGGDETGVDLGYFFVAGAGDVNGDGLGDVYAGDFENTVNGPSTGKAFVFSGAGGEVLHTFVGSGEGEGLGCGRSAGDMDGDGIPDIAAGSWQSDEGGENAGKVQVFSGATGEELRVFTSVNSEEFFGFDTVGLGDVDGDGDGDLLVSAATANRVYVISGWASDEEDDTSDIDDPDPIGDKSTGCGCVHTGGVTGIWGLIALCPLVWRRR